jgi:hypothetical protein
MQAVGPRFERGIRRLCGWALRARKNTDRTHYHNTFAQSFMTLPKEEVHLANESHPRVLDNPPILKLIVRQRVETLHPTLVRVIIGILNGQTGILHDKH